ERYIYINNKFAFSQIPNVTSLTMTKTLRIILVLYLLFMHTFLGHAQDNPKPSDMLCVGNYWTEDEGKAFLEQMQASYTTPQEWKQRAKQIRSHLLQSAGFDKFPEKSALKPVLGDVPQY